jgi:ABC-type sugar transport system permease subunit
MDAASVLQTASRPSQVARLRRWLGGSYAPYLFILPPFIFFFAFIVYPLLYALRLSFTYWHGAGAPRFIGLDNYTFLLTDSGFWKSIATSAILWLLVIPFQTLFAILAAVLLSGSTLKFRWFFRTAFLVPFVVPLVAIAQIWLIIFDPDVGMVNTVLGYVQAAPIDWLHDSTWVRPTLASLVLWKSTGFAIVLMLAGLQGIAQEVYEAAAIDGAGRFHQFVDITIPLMRRTIAFFVVTSTIGIIQLFAEPYVLFHDGGPDRAAVTAGYNLSLYINSQDLGTGAANSFLLLILLVVISIVMLRLLRSREEV